MSSGASVGVSVAGLTDEDHAAGWRRCARVLPDVCGETFRLGGNPDHPGFRLFCCDDCAVLQAGVRLGLTPIVGQILEKRREREETCRERSERMRARAPLLAAARLAHAQADPAAAAAREEHLTLRYGPARDVARDVEVRAASRKVELTCGHMTSVVLGAKLARCRACRGGGTRPKRPVSPGQKKPPRKKRPRKARQSVIRDVAQMEARYGPAREIVQELAVNVASRRVRLVCGHEAPAPRQAKRWRCGACRGAERE